MTGFKSIVSFAEINFVGSIPRKWPPTPLRGRSLMVIVHSINCCTALSNLWTIPNTLHSKGEALVENKSPFIVSYHYTTFIINVYFFGLLITACYVMVLWRVVLLSWLLLLLLLLCLLLLLSLISLLILLLHYPIIIDIKLWNKYRWNAFFGLRDPIQEYCVICRNKLCWFHSKKMTSYTTSWAFTDGNCLFNQLLHHIA